MLKVGAVGAAGLGLGIGPAMLQPSLARRGLLSPDGVFDAASMVWADALYTENYPTSPLILSPFTDELPIPKALAPEPRSEFTSWSTPPGPGEGGQNSLSNQRHQMWPGQVGSPDPLVYKLELRVAPHSFTTSEVLPIDADGRPTISFDADGKTYPAGTKRTLPPSTIYGYNGQFPGPMINNEYGKPALVRFVNRLDDNPFNLDRQDFGSPDLCFLTHLHNAHTAPESDGNPHYAMRNGPKHEGYEPGMWVDNLYLNWPAGGDDREKQSFFWFHDHTMDHTGSNVYKGMVGLFPMYDPKGGLDMGDERQGYRLPGVRTDNADGSFDVKYDVPLAFYDCRLDDGTTLHHDMHDAEGAYPDAHNPDKHPEWWGKSFYKHFPNHGFVGDVFTVNGVANPVMKVKRRKYRLRFLDASVARIYEFKLMASTQGPKSAASLGYKESELDGQYRIPDGQQCMEFLEIATDGGLVPVPFKRDSFELWPAKRREVVVDFSQYQDGSPTTKGDKIYLTNTMKMPTGRMWSNSSRFSPDPNYKVPVMMFEIEDDVRPPDDSQVPPVLRELPPLPGNWQSMLDNRLIFEVQRGSAGGETEWLINGRAFDPGTVAQSLKNKAGRSPRPSRRRAASTSGRSATEAAAGSTRSTCTWRSTGWSCATARTSAGATRRVLTTGRARTWSRSIPASR